jgi:hypothetical protein
LAVHIEHLCILLGQPSASLFSLAIYHGELAIVRIIANVRFVHEFVAFALAWTAIVLIDSVEPDGSLGADFMSHFCLCIHKTQSKSWFSTTSVTTFESSAIQPMVFFA